MPLAMTQYASSFPAAVVREYGQSLPPVIGDAVPPPMMMDEMAMNMNNMNNGINGPPPMGGAPQLATQSMRNLQNYQPGVQQQMPQNPAMSRMASGGVPPPPGAPGVGPTMGPVAPLRDSRGAPGPATAPTPVVADDEPEKAHGLKRLRQKLHLRRRHKN